MGALRTLSTFSAILLVLYLVIAARVVVDPGELDSQGSEIPAPKPKVNWPRINCATLRSFRYGMKG